MLYKYMKSRHAEGFLRDGTLRIGTLHEYRDIDKHGNVIGDDTEGKKSVITHLRGTYTPDTFPAHLSHFASTFGRGSDNRFENCLFEVVEDSRDCYIFCTTQEYSAEVMREFNADLCIAISNPKAFHRELNVAMKKLGLFRGIFPCEYRPRNVQYHEDRGFPGALIKEPKYKNQKEVRAIWESKSLGTIEPQIITCRGAIRYCSIYPKPTVQRRKKARA